MTKPARLRAFWWTLHRWIGLALMVLLVPIAVSGALLVWHDPLDALLHPARYAVTGTQLVQPSAYLASATAALAGSAQPVAAGIDDEGWPEVVGTIAGDNTVLIICPDAKSATILRARLEGLIG